MTVAFSLRRCLVTGQIYLPFPIWTHSQQTKENFHKLTPQSYLPLRGPTKHSCLSLATCVWALKVPWSPKAFSPRHTRMVDPLPASVPIHSARLLFSWMNNGSYSCLKPSPPSGWHFFCLFKGWGLLKFPLFFLHHPLWTSPISIQTCCHFSYLKKP